MDLQKIKLLFLLAENCYEEERRFWVLVISFPNRTWLFSVVGKQIDTINLHLQLSRFNTKFPIGMRKATVYLVNW